MVEWGKCPSRTVITAGGGPAEGGSAGGQGGGASGGPDRRAGLPRAEEELGARGRSAEEAAGASALPNEGGEVRARGGHVGRTCEPAASREQPRRPC